MSCGVGCRRGSDPTLLCRRPEATTLIGPQAWESPHAMSVALKKKKDKKIQIHKYESYCVVDMNISIPELIRGLIIYSEIVLAFTEDWTNVF